MKKATAVLAGVIIGMFMFCNMAMAAEKFGYVSIDRIGDAYLKAKEYMKILEDKEKVFTDEIDKKRNEVKAFQDKINLLSDKEKEAKNTELENKIKSLQDMVREKQADLRKEQVDKTIELSKDIKNAIDKYASKESFTLVFDAAALAYQPKGMDITDKIIDILNKEYKK
ncbi:MAG: OmpH family outer membrane protein [Candidatus Omnitrophica bacterium]|nr:OmpH family outer membrane protein [Candidatus Omnitrophota bacterium]MDD5653988.1 OmpH family outer membrane protein [Candidatus Omnitrophota bacterium]